MTIVSWGLHQMSADMKYSSFFLSSVTYRANGPASFFLARVHGAILSLDV